MQALNVQGEASAWLAAVVHNSFDAILSKTLDGTITSWNAAAERLYGYSAEEAIGRSMALIIPGDRLAEEDRILAQLRRGESIEHYETVRRHRSGRLIDIELSVSPVRDQSGAIVGASTIARDIGERKQRASELALLVREMHHRISNLLAVVHGIVTFSRRQARSIDEFATDISERIVALGAAQQLILPDPDGRPISRGTSLGAVVGAVLKPYAEVGRIQFGGSSLLVGQTAITALALLLHELATNAVKYGALSAARGALDIAVEELGERVRIVWRETGGRTPQPQKEGFGSALLRVASHGLDATIERHWEKPLLTVTIEIPKARLAI